MYKPRAWTYPVITAFNWAQKPIQREEKQQQKQHIEYLQTENGQPYVTNQNTPTGGVKFPELSRILSSYIRERK